MTTTVNIQNLISNIKSNGWVAMRAAVTGFIRVVMETVLTLEQHEQMGCCAYERSERRADPDLIGTGAINAPSSPATAFSK